MIMKKIIYTVILAAAVLTGCKEVTPELPTGLQLKVTTDDTFVDKIVKSGASVDINTFSVEIVKKDGKFSNTWLYGELPSLVELSVGEYTVTVNVARYQSVSFDEYVRNTLNTIISEEMTDLQKLEAIAKHVAEEYSYMVNFSGAESMFLNGGGDCWASTDMIITLGTAAGLDVRQRPEAGTTVFGGGHMNAI
jgi:hypothetical protein